jgi:hypothetical protein
MSLIHEALRKARREPDEEDARGVAYARGLTGRRHRGVGAGIVIGAVLAVAAGAAVGLGMWLWLGDRSGPEPAAAGSGAATSTAAGGSGLESALSQPATGSAAVTTAATAAPAQGASGDRAAASTGSGQPPGELTAGAEPLALPAAEQRPSPPAERATPRETRGPGGERVFHVEADVGYASLVVDYIVDRPSDPFARINGLDVRVGGTIEGFTVEEITSTAVRLRDARGPLVLMVP